MMAEYYIGVDLGGTNIAVGIVDADYHIVKKSSVPTLAKRGAEAVIADMASLCVKMCGEMGLDINNDISGIGIAAPGTVNPATGVVEYSNNIKMDNTPMAEMFSSCCDVPADRIIIGNDANFAALGEYVNGGAKGSESAVMITLGTGVGGGVVQNGKILTGCAFGGAELGHTVIEFGGRQCTCGRRGCFEAYSSATALVALTKEKYAVTKDTLMHKMTNGDIGLVGGKTAFAAMKQGDETGAEVVNTYIGYLACGIANMINIFQPEVFLIGGGVCNEGDNLLVPLRKRVAEQIYSRDHVLKTRISVAELGNDAGIIGAAAAIKDKLA